MLTLSLLYSYELSHAIHVRVHGVLVLHSQAMAALCFDANPHGPLECHHRGVLVSRRDFLGGATRKGHSMHGECEGAAWWMWVQHVSTGCMGDAWLKELWVLPSGLHGVAIHGVSPSNCC